LGLSTKVNQIRLSYKENQRNSSFQQRFDRYCVWLMGKTNARVVGTAYRIKKITDKKQ
jgi:hypothetical protein